MHSAARLTEDSSEGIPGRDKRLVFVAPVAREHFCHVARVISHRNRAARHEGRKTFTLKSIVNGIIFRNDA